jgi:hypothetical protein
MRLAWPTMKHRFSVRHPELSKTVIQEDVEHVYFGNVPRLNLLKSCPVDLLVVDRSHVTKPPLEYRMERCEEIVEATFVSCRPRVVLEVYPPGAQLWDKGPASKVSRTRWAERGYVSRFRRVNATQVGGAISQVRLLVSRVQLHYAPGWVWGEGEDEAFTPRPMSNLLTPPGMVRASSYGTPPGSIPSAFTDPMPATPGAWISTDRGSRRLQFEETARALGVPKDWGLTSGLLSSHLLVATTSLFH